MIGPLYHDPLFSEIAVKPDFSRLNARNDQALMGNDMLIRVDSTPFHATLNVPGACNLSSNV